MAAIMGAESVIRTTLVDLRLWVSEDTRDEPGIRDVLAICVGRVGPLRQNALGARYQDKDADEEGKHGSERWIFVGSSSYCGLSWAGQG
jgi:hypothetical protein